MLEMFAVLPSYPKGAGDTLERLRWSPRPTDAEIATLLMDAPVNLRLRPPVDQSPAVKYGRGYHDGVLRREVHPTEFGGIVPDVAVGGHHALGESGRT